VNQRNGLEEQLVSGLVGLYILAIIVMIWAAFKALELVLRVMIAHPDNRWLWAALGLCLVSMALLALTQGQSPAINAIAGLSIVVLLTLAKGVEIYHDQMFARETNREMMVDQVLTEPWFQLP
jgi:hypothetical protein